MRKFSLGLLIGLLIPFSSFAVNMQGGCSSHGGIDISIGSDIDGSVICNDGWVNSSVLFMPTPPTQSFNCSSQSDVAALQSQLISSGSSQYAPISSDGLIQTCQSNVNQFQSALIDYQSRLSAYNQQLQHQLAWAQQARKQQASNKVQVQQQPSNNFKSYCEANNGTYISDSSCPCKDGYYYDSVKNVCILTPVVISAPLVPTFIGLQMPIVKKSVKKTQSKLIIKKKK